MHNVVVGRNFGQRNKCSFANQRYFLLVSRHRHQDGNSFNSGQTDISQRLGGRCPNVSDVICESPHKGFENIAMSTRIMSKQGCESICRQAFEYAKKHGRKSVTLRLRFRAPDHTLQREAVDERIAPLLEALQTQLGAEIRR